MNEPTTQLDPVERDRLTSEHLDELLASLDFPGMSWPAETGAVVEMAQRLGYRTDADDVLHLLSLGTPVVDLVGGKRHWRPYNAATLVSVLELRRRWTLHPHHAHKLSNLERLQAEFDAAGRGSAITDLEKFDVEQLLLIMEGCEMTPVRHAARLAIQQKLKNGEGL